MTSIDNSVSLSIELSSAFVTGILSKLHDRFLPLVDWTRSMMMSSNLILKFRTSNIK
jgi:hypothetical protein